MSFYQDEDQSLATVNDTSKLAQSVPGAGEVFKAAWVASGKSMSTASEYWNETEQYGNIKEIAKKYNFDLLNPHLIAEPVSLDETNYNVDENSFPGTHTKEQKITEFHKQLDEYKFQNPQFADELKQKGLDSRESLLNTIKVDAQQSWNNAEELYQKTNKWGAVGYYGALAARVTVGDPVFAPLLPLTVVAPYSTSGLSFLQAAARVAKIEAVIGATQNGALEAMTINYQQELGLKEPGFANAVKDVAIATGVGAVAGGTLGPVIYGAGVGITKGITKIPKAYEISKEGLDYLGARLQRLETGKLDEIYTYITDKFPNFKSYEADTLSNSARFNVDDNTLVDTPQGVREHESRTTAALNSVVNDAPLNIPDTSVNPVSPVKFQEQVFSHSSVKLLKPNEIDFDAKAFQYKGEVDASGVSSKLRDVKDWNDYAAGALMVYQNKEGKYFVIDGHQRLGLSKRLTGQGKDINLVTKVIREADGVTKEEAMFSGVVANIINGTGTSFDAAKVLRTFPQYNIDTLKGSFPMGQRMAKNTAGLVKLSDDAWGLFVSKNVNEDLAARVGEAFTKEAQVGVLSGLRNRKFATLAEMDSTIASIKGMQLRVTEQTDLFGTQFIKDYAIIEKAKLIQYVSQNAKRLKLGFESAIKNDKELTAAGNVLDQSQNLKAAIDNEKITEFINTVGNRVGQYADELNAAALKFRTDQAGARLDAINATRAALTRGDFESTKISRGNDFAEFKDTTPRLPEKPAEIIDRKFADVENNIKVVTDANKKLDDQIFGDAETTPVKTDETVNAVDNAAIDTIERKKLDLTPEQKTVVNKIDEIVNGGKITEQDVLDIRNSAEVQKAINERADYYSKNHTDVAPNFVNGKFTDEYLNNKTYTFNGKEYKGVDNIVNAIYGTGSKSKERIAIVITGLPASGKSRLSSQYKQKINGTIVDTDFYREVIPEYNNGIGSAAVHSEAKVIFKKMFVKTLTNGDNVILPTLGRNETPFINILESLKEANYKTAVIRLDADLNVAKLRNFKRTFETGRLVEEDILTQQVDNNIKNNYIKVTNEQANAKAEVTTSNDQTNFISGSEQDVVKSLTRDGQIRGNVDEGSITRNQTAEAEKAIDQAQELPTPENIVKITDKEEVISFSPDGKEVRVKDLLQDEFDDVKFIETLKNCI